MLYPFQEIARARFPLAPVSGPRPAPGRLLEIMLALDRLFDETPAVLHLPGGCTLTLLYRNVRYLWQDICDNVGGAAADLSAALPLRFFGTTEARETAELTLRGAGREAEVCLRSVSGRSFDHLQGLGVQLELPGAEAAHALAQAVGAAARGGSCGVLPRRYERFLQANGLLASTQGSLFAYLVWEQTPARQLLYALDSGHKMLLWRAFLEDCQQPLEFDWLWEHYYSGEPLFLLEWELALRTVLDELGFRVERGAASFQVAGPDGRARRFDFARGGPAEKLFLKLLFPLDTK